MKTTRISIFWLSALLLLFSPTLHAQYFGQNKPNYESFDFKVLESPHFECYHYLHNEDALHEIGQHAEHWYLLHQAILQDTFDQKNPIILYNDHADFQQTNTISGNIGVGTGGVTEALKNRVVMPLTLSNQQTNHVLGHELVHAFQYHMILQGDSTNIRNLANLPLWMVEGLAEYLSIGRTDAHTAMWMRDAVLQDDVPSIENLSNPKYFPYRYGQAFWAFLTGIYGDQIIRPFFMGTAKYGLKVATKRVLNTDLEQLSKRWQSTLKKHYKSQMKRSKEKRIGKALLSEKNAGTMNISPVLSPNGKYVVFLSEKNLFSLDLFLADTRSGKVIRQIASTTRDGHIDDFNYLESAGTWSPNSKKFAFVVVSKGNNQLLIKDISNGKTLQKISLPKLPSFSQPAWSRDGRSIVVSALVNGQTDLYSIHLKTQKVTQLTNDPHAELQAHWSADGQKLVYATDRLSRLNGQHHGKWTFNLAILDVVSGKSEDLDLFLGADNLNPLFDAEQNIIFISDRDGFRNIYKYDRNEDRVFQLSDFLTGVSGITKYSPAISISRKRERLAYSHYLNKQYTVHQSRLERFQNQEVPKDSVNMSAAVLPVSGLHEIDVVNRNLHHFDQLAELPDTAFQEKAYRPRFKLDYVGGNAGVGVSTGNTNFGSNAALAGGVDFLFSDILGNNQLYAGVALNGELTDISGQLTYLNRKGKIAWGASLSHFTFRSGFNSRPVPDVLKINGSNQEIPVQRVDLNLSRVFEDRLRVFAQFPLSRSRRFEAGASVARYSFRQDVQPFYYDNFGNLLLIGNREKLENAPPGFNLYSTNAAYVSDNSVFGLTSPLAGHRLRIGVEKYFGAADFVSTTVDYRKYQRLQPITLAFRAMHLARYGDDSALPTLYAGDPTFVRGYHFNSINQTLQDNNLSFGQLTGSKLLVTNFEIRLPFTGPKKLAALPSKFFFSD